MLQADVRKIEGLESHRDCEAIAALTRSNRRENVACVVLGRGADDPTVENWLGQAAGVPGYVGFAVGRTIWWDAVRGYLTESIEREQAIRAISGRYRRFIDVYSSAE